VDDKHVAYGTPRPRYAHSFIYLTVAKMSGSRRVVVGIADDEVSC
jgi:hypothetical protein